MDEASWPTVFVWSVLLGLIPAYIGWRKGDSFLKMWAFGALLFVIALPVAIFEKPNQKELDRRRIAKGEVRCPFCREFVNVDAVVCPHCRRDIKPTPSINAAASQAETLPEDPTYPQLGMSLPRSDEIPNQTPAKVRKPVPGAALVIGGIAAGLVICSPVFSAAYLSRVEEQQRSSTPHASAPDSPSSSSEWPPALKAEVLARITVYNAACNPAHPFTNEFMAELSGLMKKESDITKRTLIVRTGDLLLLVQQPALKDKVCGELEQSLAIIAKGRQDHPNPPSSNESQPNPLPPGKKTCRYLEGKCREQ